MEYEQKYKEALRVIEGLYNVVKYQSNSDALLTSQTIEKAFPELKESEDERMLREIKRYIKEQGDKPTGLPNGTVAVSDMIAWLEKQGEQMSDPRYSILDKLIEADDIYQMSVNDAMVEEAKNKAIEALSKLVISKLLGLEKQGEQKPYPETLDKAIELYYYSYGNEKGGFDNLSLEKFKDIIKTFVEDYGNKSAWSEDDEKFLNYAISLTDDTQIKNFLKSLKDRTQPQSKQEWSEYDKIQLSEAIQMIEANGTWIRSEDAVKKVSNWLKSLKPNHWKPSKQNIKDLEWCADLVQDKMGVCFHRLQVFIDEIKKL